MNAKESPIRCKVSASILSTLAGVTCPRACTSLAHCASVPTLMRSGPVPVYAIVAGIVANALYIAAAIMLFRADAKLWFGEAPSADDGEDVA